MSANKFLEVHLIAFGPQHVAQRASAKQDGVCATGSILSIPLFQTPPFTSSVADCEQNSRQPFNNPIR